MNLRLTLLLALGFILLSCAQQKRRQLVEDAPLISQTYTDQTGREVSLTNTPQRVVSIAPTPPEMVSARGGGARLVPPPRASNYPPAGEDTPAVTTYPELDLEQLQATGAELVLTTDEIFSPDDLALLDNIGLPVYLQHYETLDDVYRGIRDLGELLGRKAPANALADSLQDLEEAVTAATENQIKYRTMILISADPLKVVGGTGFLHQLIEKAGGMNIYEEAEDAYHVTTLEEIMKLQPEFLILPSKNTQVYNELLEQFPMLYNTPAAYQKQVHVMDPDLLYRPGPRMLDGLLALTSILHSKLTSQRFLDPDFEEGIEE